MKAKILFTLSVILFIFSISGFILMLTNGETMFKIRILPFSLLGAVLAVMFYNIARMNKKY